MLPALLRRALAASLVAASLTAAAVALDPPAAAAQTAGEPTVVAEGLDAWHAALTAADAAPADAIFLGNSITHGAYAPTRPEWWVDIARRWMQGAWGGAGLGYVPASWPWFSDYQWVTTGGQIVETSGLALRSYLLDSADDVAEISVTGTSVQVFFATGPDRGTARILVDGAEAGTVSTTAATVGATTWRSPVLGRGQHTVRVEPVMSGAPRNRLPVVLEGLAVFDGDEAAGVRTWDSGHGGLGTTHYGDRLSWAASAAQVDPELVVIELGTNDYQFQLTAAEFEANLRRIIDAARAAADGPISVALMPMWVGTGRDPVRYGQYVEVQRRLAEELDLALVDLSGLDARLYTDDGVHPNTVGQRAIANVLLDAIDPSYVPATTPPPPVEVMAASGPGATDATVSWPASDGASVYVVRAVDADDPSVVVSQQRVASTTATFASLPTGSYVFQVFAEGLASYSAPTSSAPVSTAAPPPAPAAATATAEPGAVALAWEPSAGATYYAAQLFDTAGNFVEQVWTSETSAYYDGLTPGASYSAIVYAFNDAGASPPATSNTVTVPPAEGGPPPAPTGVTAAASPGAVGLTWEPAPGADFYVAQLFDSNGTFVEQVYTDEATAAFDELVPGRSYYADVYGLNDAGASAPSRSNTVTVPQQPPPAPTNVTATELRGGARVTWQPSAGATEYLVQAYDMTTNAFVGQQTLTGTSATFSLTPRRSYAFLVYARNAAGYSAGTASNTVTVRR